MPIPPVVLPDPADEPTSEVRQELIRLGLLRPSRTTLRRVRPRPGERRLELDADAHEAARRRIARPRGGAHRPDNVLAAALDVREPAPDVQRGRVIEALRSPRR